MGKTARWFRGLLGGKKTESRPPTVSDSAPAKEKKRWRFVRSFRDKDRTAPSGLVAGDERTGSYREGSCSLYVEGVEQNKHAIAVAAATAAVADAAVAAAQAAAAVVKLTSSGRSVYVSRVDVRREDWAAVKIQAAFRGYLARRALRALRGLVKLQALVRGHIVRKQAAETLRCMHALVRVQARARAGRVQSSENSHSNKSSLSHPGPATPEKHESSIRAKSSNHQSPATLNLQRNPSKPNSTDTVDLHKMHVGWNWLDRWMDERSWDHREDEKNDKILEIDTGKPRLNTIRRTNNLQFAHSTLLSDKNGHSFATLPDSPSKDSTTAQLSVPSPSSVEMQSLSPLKFPIDVEDPPFCTANNSPQFLSASSRSMSTRKGPFTPSKSDPRSLFSGYSDHPNYMANTESSRAKVRSQSAPKQRLEFEKSRSTKRVSSVHGSATLHSKFTSKAYPGSGRLDRLGMPI